LLIRTSNTGEAYRTLVKSANRSHPDLQNDPVWNASDFVFDNFDFFAKNFADCSSTTTYSDSSFDAKVPDYKTCMRGPTPVTSCSATRSFEVSSQIFEVNLASAIRIQADYRFDLTDGSARISTDFGPSKAEVPTLDFNAVCNGPGTTRIRLLNVSPWYQSGISAPDGGLNVDTTATPTLVQGPNCRNGLVGRFRHFDNGCSSPPCDNVWTTATTLRFKIEHVDSQTWSWSNPSCPELMKAVNDQVCSFTAATCNKNPFRYDPDRQQRCFSHQGVLICESDLEPQVLPAEIPQTCNDFTVDTNCDFTGSSNNGAIGTVPCWTDVNGQQVCPGDVAGQTGQSCQQLEQQGCSFIRSECVEGTEGASGTCWQFKDIYDCGTTYGIPTLDGTTKQECSGPVRCMGEDCITVDRKKSKDFVRALAVLNALQHAAMDKTCVTDQFGFSQCAVFKGDPGTCKIVGSIQTFVDCCNTPMSIGLADYLELLESLSQMDDAVMRLGSDSAIRGSWEVLRDPVTNTFDSALGLMDRAYDSIVGNDLMCTNTVSNFFKQSIIDDFKVAAMKYTAQWVADTFGAQAANLFFSIGGGEAFNASGQMTGSASSLQMGGAVGSVLYVLYVIYVIYVIVQIVVKMVWQCEKPEYELAAKKELKSCHYLGSYCKTRNEMSVCLEHRESYCCFASPLARIIQEQVRPQLGMTFGTPQNQDCSGIPIDKLETVDWDRVNLDEWIGILQSTGRLPTAQTADQKYNLDKLTGKGSRLNVDGTRLNTLERNQKRLDEGLDVPSVRTNAEAQGWSLGPKPQGQ
jgi:conjugal transfer mating pair stabilization protein TraN